MEPPFLPGRDRSWWEGFDRRPGGPSMPPAHTAKREYDEFKRLPRRTADTPDLPHRCGRGGTLLLTGETIAAEAKKTFTILHTNDIQGPIGSLPAEDIRSKPFQRLRREKTGGFKAIANRLSDVDDPAGGRGIGTSFDDLDRLPGQIRTQ